MIFKNTASFFVYLLLIASFGTANQLHAMRRALQKGLRPSIVVGAACYYYNKIKGPSYLHSTAVMRLTGYRPKSCLVTMVPFHPRLLLPKEDILTHKPSMPKTEPLPEPTPLNDTDAHAHQLIKEFLASTKHPKHIYSISKGDLTTQDQLCAHLMSKLLNPDDKTPYSAIAQCFTYCHHIQETYPEFTQLIQRHAENPSPRTFVQEINNLSQEHMPEHFYLIKETHRTKINAMGWRQKISFALAIYNKF